MNPTNKVQLTGNLGANPEIRKLENGTKFAKFSMATNEEYTTRSGERSSNTQWHFITVWGKLVERVETELQKGSMVSIEGRISNRSYLDKNGQKRYVTEIVANEFSLNQKSS
jgi:single-strand DNA-binding protein